MANSAGSQKRARQAIKRNKHNSQIRAKMRTTIKKVTYALAEGKKEAVASAWTDMQKSLDMAVSKGLIHKNLAARKKSRINAHIKAL